MACLVLVLACFMPWTWHEDLKETFTGFYSHDNHYGRPGRFLTLVAVIAFVLMYLPRIWAKRTNLFVCALGVGYAIKSFILFTSCYNTYCPEKKAGIYVMLIATVVMLAAAVFPDLKMKDKKHPENVV